MELSLASRPFFTEEGAVRYRCLHLVGGLVLYLHETCERMNTRIGERLVWKQLRSLVDNGRGLFAGETTHFERKKVLAVTAISKTSWEALSKTAAGLTYLV